MVDPSNIPLAIEEMRREIKALQKDLYGNPQIRQKGVFDRLENLEERLHDLRTTYEREKIELSYVAGLEGRLDGLEDHIGATDLKLATVLIYLKGIAAGVGSIIVPLFIAGILFAFRFFGGG